MGSSSSCQILTYKKVSSCIKKVEEKCNRLGRIFEKGDNPRLPFALIDYIMDN